jgi:hypothetical protein
MVIGSVDEFPDESSARQRITALGLEINRSDARMKHRPLTISELVDHYRQHDLNGGTGSSFLKALVNAFEARHRLEDPLARGLPALSACSFSRAAPAARSTSVTSALTLTTTRRHSLRELWREITP